MAVPFTPAAWLPGGDLPTVWATVARPFPRPPFRRERWELPDGDFLDADRLDGAPGRPLLVVSHGLEGDSRASYVRSIAAAASRRGLAVVAWNFRGCSGEPNRLLRQYHSGDTGDLATVVARVISEDPYRTVLVAGFSLGGNQLVKWLGEQGVNLPGQVRAAAAISVPFDLAACAEALDGPGFWPWIYRERFLRRLRQKASIKAAQHPGAIDLPAVLRARTFAEYDGLVTAPIHGFASARDYWERCSSGRFLGGVRLPLLLVSAEDDPFVPATSIPTEVARRNPTVTLEVTAGGGHVGFVSGSPLRPVYWAEERVVEFLAGS
jgi:predicted alpha/beta-fold hydrolase